MANLIFVLSLRTFYENLRNVEFRISLPRFLLVVFNTVTKCLIDEYTEPFAIVYPPFAYYKISSLYSFPDVYTFSWRLFRDRIIWNILWKSIGAFNCLIRFKILHDEILQFYNELSLCYRRKKLLLPRLSCSAHYVLGNGCIIQIAQFPDMPKVIIAGAGLVGALNACYFAKRGWEVEVYEYRKDIRTMKHVHGRSINLALSQRGKSALEAVGLRDYIVNQGTVVKQIPYSLQF